MLYDLLIPEVYISGCPWGMTIVHVLMWLCRNTYYPAYSCQVMNNRWLMLSAIIFITLLISCGCTSVAPSPSIPVSPVPGQTVSPPVLSSALPGAFSLNVDSLAPGSVLPDTNSCKGAGESPDVSWDGIPAGTKSLALILDDPDAYPGTFTHWLVYNIPPKTGSISAGQTAQKVLANGAQQGDSSAGSRGYYPPCPPVGTTHKYVFRLYAVDMDITQPTADRDSINWALQGHTLAKTEFVTTLTR
jgi:Raf kinase inhibitor-like YbhB/YbcL family protein